MNKTIINKDFDMLKQVVAEFNELYTILKKYTRHAFSW